MRKPKLTQELVDKAVELRGHGLSNADICHALCIDESTLYRWLSENDTELKRKLNEGLKKADSDLKQRMLDCIVRAAEDKTQHWTASAWILERKYPDEYAKTERKSDEHHEDAPHITLGVNVNVAAAEDTDGDN